MLYCSILYYNIVCYVILYYITLYYIILYYIIAPSSERAVVVSASSGKRRSDLWPRGDLSVCPLGGFTWGP